MLVCLCCYYSNLIAQIVPDDDHEEKKEDYLEQVIEENEETTGDYEGIVDLEANFRKHPINLNTANKEDLMPLHELVLLTDIQINSILSYREKLGNFTSIYELQAVPYIDPATAKSLLPYIKISSDISANQLSPKELLIKGDYTLLVRGQQILQEQKGYISDTSSSSKYLGSPLGLYARFRYQNGTKFSYGITGQKDPGEEFFKGSQPKGFDFYSYHLYYRGNKFIRALALGDYELRFGQGLLTAQGFGVSKSSLITSIKYGGRTLRPYTSVNETNFFRGAATVLGIKKFYITAFASYKKIDGNVGAVDTLGENVYVTSVGGDGLHRTESELADKNAIKQSVYGVNIDYAFNSLNIGITGLRSQFSAPLQPSNEPYNEFKFSGDHLANGAVHYDWNYRNFNLFGEGAMSEGGGMGFLSGMLISVDPRIDFALLYRNYSRDFHSLYANAFAESSTADNESGLYTGVIIRPVRKWQIDGYVDFFKKPWLDFNIDAPSSGTEYLLQVTYKPNKVLEIYGRWKDETKQQNSSLNDEPFDYVVDTRKQNLRFQVSYKATRSIALRSRVEWVIFKEEMMSTQHGFLAYQDVVYKKMGFPLQLTGRFCLFDADTYDARIYAYENDVLYAYSIPSFSNRGIRFYLIGRYTITRGLDFWMRFAQTYYSNLDVVGSGLDEIQGNTKSEIKAELRLKF